MSLVAAIAGLQIAFQTGGIQLGIPNLKPAPDKDQVLVKVNGQDIKASDIAALLWDAKAEEILNEVTYFQLAKAEADKLGIFLTGKEIDEGVQRELDGMKANLAPGQTLEQAMLSTGQTRARLYLAVKTSLLLTKIAFADFDPKLYVKVSTIIIKPASNSANDLANAIKTAQGAYDRLVKGEAWEAVVDDVVTDETGRESRGRLGWRLLSAFPDDVRSEIALLKSNQFSKPAQIQNGIQFFRVERFGKDLAKEELDQMRIDMTESLRLQAVNKIRRTMTIQRVWPPQPKKPGV
jgi:parvulin-like peptidyl-prolyl isomerase